MLINWRFGDTVAAGLITSSSVPACYIPKHRSTVGYPMPNKQRMNYEKEIWALPLLANEKIVLLAFNRFKLFDVKFETRKIAFKCGLSFNAFVELVRELEARKLIIIDPDWGSVNDCRVLPGEKLAGVYE